MRKFRGKQAMTLGLLMFLIGLIAAVAVLNTIDSKETVASAANYSANPIEDGQIYEFKNVIAFDEYARSDYNGGSDKDHFYVVGKLDKSSGNWVLYSLCVNEDDELFKTLNDYVNNKDMLVGDLEISFCARSADYLTEDQQIRGYYDIAANKYNLAAFDGNGVVEKAFNFNYVFAGADDLKDYNKQHALIEGFSVSFLLVLAILGFVIFYRNLRRVIRGEV